MGFGRGCNLGARESSGKYLFFLNPDTQLMNDAAASLVQCLNEHPGALAAGPAIFDSEGTVTRTCRRLPHLGHVVLDATGLDRWCGAYKMTRFAHDQAKQVDQVIGAAMVIRRRDYERLGGMDEQFFIYFEEVDLCKRFNKRGATSGFGPALKLQHLAGRSCEADSVRARMIFVLRESRKKYFTKHYGVLGGLALEAVNRMEAIQKSIVLTALWMVRHKRTIERRLKFLGRCHRCSPTGLRSTTMFRVLAFTVKPRESADTRYRILQYCAVAERDGISIEHRSLMGSRYFQWQMKNVQLLPAVDALSRIAVDTAVASAVPGAAIRRRLDMQGDGARWAHRCWRNCWSGEASA